MSIDVGLEAHIGILGEKIDRLNKHFYDRTGIVNQVPLLGQINLTAGAGTLDSGTQFEPTAGTIMSVRRLTAYGYSAGSVTGFISSLEPVAPFPQQGVFTYGRGDILLYPGEKLTFTATGITLNTGFTAVQIFGRADWFPAWYLSEYLD